MGFFDIFSNKNKTLKTTLAIEKEKRLQEQARKAVINLVYKTQNQQGQALTGLKQQLFPSPEKSQGSLTRTGFLYSSSNDRLRNLSRIARFESTDASSQINRLADIVIGAGLQLRLTPMWDLIPQAPESEERSRWIHQVEERYKLWSKSYRPEFNKRRNLYQLSYTLFEYLLQDGEYFVLLRYSNTQYENPLTLQIIPPENIGGGRTTTEGYQVINGIEYDSYGEAVAYFIKDDKNNTVKVPRFGSKSGRIFMIHNFLSTTEKQKRGVPYLSNVIEELIKIGDYERLEIQAAIVNALYAVWVKPPQDTDGEDILQAISKKNNPQDSATPTDTQDFINSISSADINKGGLFVDALPAGHELQSFDTKRPNVNFGLFRDQVMKSISASKGMPLSVTDMEFNGSYSAARGELLLFWNAVTRYRQNHGYDFEDDVFQMWFIGEVLRNKIKAPLALQNKEILLAYTNAEWIGSQRPDIDPQKSANANLIEQQNGWKTNEQITTERGGGDFQENLQKLVKEMPIINTANGKSSQTPQFVDDNEE